MSEPFGYNTSIEEQGSPMAGVSHTIPDEERPPSCPSCHRRLVILATHWARDNSGQSVRRQLWGCPIGHSTAYRTGGTFTPVELLPDVAG